MKYHLLGLDFGSSLVCSISHTPVLQFGGATGRVILNQTTYDEGTELGQLSL